MNPTMQPQKIVQLPVIPKPRNFQPPSIHAAQMQGIKIGLPEIEVEKFMAHYGANGWRVGRTKMQSWPHAMAGWKLRWQERETQRKERNGAVSASVQMMNWRDELKRVEEAMAKSRGAHWTANNGWDSRADHQRYAALAERKLELLRLMGAKV